MVGVRGDTCDRSRRSRKRYGGFAAVRDVSFSVNQGEIFGILGPNGSGKMATIECLQGLRRRDGGAVSVLGLDPATPSVELRHRIGSQLQESAHPDRMRVWEALDLFGSLNDRGPSVDALLADWGLSDKRLDGFGALSGGQQHRLFVALALVNDPELVFLDEMTTRSGPGLVSSGVGADPWDPPGWHDRGVGDPPHGRGGGTVRPGCRLQVGFGGGRGDTSVAEPPPSPPPGRGDSSGCPAAGRSDRSWQTRDDRPWCRKGDPGTVKTRGEGARARCRPC